MAADVAVAPELDLRIDATRAVVGGSIQPATIGITGGRITLVAPHGTQVPAARVDVLDEAVVLLPGLVDTHVHICEPGHADWEGFTCATKAAAAGGVTTLVDMPLDSVPVTTSVRALHDKQTAARGQAWVDVGFWAGLVPDNLTELESLAAEGVTGFKCFLADSGTPEFPPVDAATLTLGMTVIAELGLPLLVHAESAARLRSAPAARGPRYADFLVSRPDEVEADAVAIVLDAVRATGATAHIVHVSSASALPLIAAARSEGLPVSAETCPHYLSLAADDVGDGQTQFACCPPIRDAANAHQLWAALGDGTLSMIVSDHSPAPAARKETGDFGTAWGGISSLQVSLAVTWTAARARGYGLADVAGWMAAAPAALAGLPDRGTIAVGATADLCAFDPDAEQIVEPARLWHRQPSSPYAGRRLSGVVRATWLRGERVDAGGDPRGRLVRTGAVHR